VALALTLTLAGKEDIPLATEALQRIRFDRVVTVQKTGESNRDKWHTADTTSKEADIELPFPEWILNFDIEQHVQEGFPAVKKAILDARSTRG